MRNGESEGYEKEEVEWWVRDKRKGEGGDYSTRQPWWLVIQTSLSLVKGM